MWCRAYRPLEACGRVLRAHTSLEVVSLAIWTSGSMENEEDVLRARAAIRQFETAQIGGIGEILLLVGRSGHRPGG